MTAKVKPKRFELTCKSDLKEIGKVEKFLQRMNTSAKLDDGTFYRLLVACTEAVNNAIMHGNKYDPRRNVVVVCLLTKAAARILVKDEGSGFDPRKLPDPLDERNLMKEHGRGVFLMTSMADRLKFKRLKKGMVVEMFIDLKRLR
jgi:serine/threonine-protein kinase RsbW